ncbi:hypothetical protein AYL99_02541 [Fonsecaea erecta]|uniref:Transcription factor domain-containing protein n=1 Tax=Fonsecaea erecta TaxID=1367422 RepID=A0A178ZU65_9EURO|nr:hypothetical protein AYL99_02541 [Fonsecaea erecta]OAP63314.1 hypothetical protein AYL99_02541 [Fonsecaea erecta]
MALKKKKKKNSDRYADFTFVNISRPDDSRQRSTQRIVRHHVMARVAESRKKPPRFVTLAVRLPSAEVDSVVIEDNEEASAHRAGQDLHCYEEVPRSLHPYALFPVETNGRARQLIQFMQIEGEYLYRPFRNEWFTMAVIDCTAFYLSLANAALFFHQMTERRGCEYGDFEESSRYLSLCLNQVAQRLGRESHNISQGVITTVLGFLCHDSTVGRWDRYAVHMKGLDNIIRLRGGLQALNSNTVMFASWYGQPVNKLLARIRNASEGLADTAFALEKAAQLAAFVNVDRGNPLFWKAGATAANRITPVLHFLLSLRRPTDEDSYSYPFSEVILREVVRLALLILVASVKQAFSLIADELAILQQRFSALVPMAPCIDTSFPELSLWAIIMVHSMPSNQSHKLDARATVDLMRAMGISSGKSAINVAKDLIWIDELMEMKVPEIILEIDHALCSSETDQGTRISARFLADLK